MIRGWGGGELSSVIERVSVLIFCMKMLMISSILFVCLKTPTCGCWAIVDDVIEYVLVVISFSSLKFHIVFLFNVASSLPTVIRGKNSDNLPRKKI